MITRPAYTLSYSITNLGKRVDCLEIFNYVDTDNTFNNSNFVTSIAALPIQQAVLLCAGHSELLFCVRIGNSRKSLFPNLL